LVKVYHSRYSFAQSGTFDKEGKAIRKWQEGIFWMLFPKYNVKRDSGGLK